jgi:hypothetical protein
MKKFGVITAILISVVSTMHAQDLPSGTEQQFENLNDVTEEETEDDAYLQQLKYYTLHPLNINEATREELQALKLLNPLQIESLLQYRNLLGSLIHAYELQAVPQWDIPTIRKVVPYVTVSNKAHSIANRFTKGSRTLLLRNTRQLEKAKGYDTSLPNHYAGDRNHLLFRYKYQYKNELQYGIVGDKDAGEAFFKSRQRSGFDFYSVHFFARRIGRIKALALGDFTVNMGQGLMQWQALAFKKSTEPLAVIRQAPTLMPYYSSGEYNFHRGAGITLQQGIWETTVFGSLRNLSANLGTDSGVVYFTSFSTSGLHRTASELQDKRGVRQATFGATIKRHGRSFNLALNAVQYQFSKPMQKRPEPYNRYAISGRDWYNISTDYNLVYKNLYLFGEAAVDKRGSTAFTNGVLTSIDPKVDIALLHRHIAKSYQAVQGNAFTENVAPANERGLYMGLTVRPAAAWRINGYADFFKFPWLKYRVDAPSGGQDYMLHVNYQPRKTLEMYLRYRREQKGGNEWTADSSIRFTGRRTRQNLRLHGTYVYSPSLTLKSRAEGIWYFTERSKAGKGFLFYVESAHGVLKKFNFHLRLQYFSTDGYNSRIYAYESDVLYSYSTPAFFDTGLRYYFNLQYNVSKGLSVWLRWAQTVYTKEHSIGSGLNSIEGNTASEVKCQASYRF